MFQRHAQSVQENTDGDERIKEREADNLIQHFLQLDKGGVGLPEVNTTLAIPLVKQLLFVFFHIYDREWGGSVQGGREVGGESWTGARGKRLQPGISNVSPFLG